MKPLMLTVLALLSAPVMAEPLTNINQTSEQFSLIAVLLIGAASLILARRRAS